MPIVDPYHFGSWEWNAAHYAGAPWPEDSLQPVRVSKARIRQAIAVCARKIDTVASGGLGGEFAKGEDAQWIQDLAGAIRVLSSYL